MIKELILVILGNTQFVVTTITMITILHLHSFHSIYFTLGTLVATFTAKLLKKCIKQPRPLGATKFTKTYGMPSTHSSSISFFGTYLSLSTLFLPLHPKLVPNLLQNIFPPSSISSSTEWGLRILIALIWIGGAISVCWSRIKLGHHTSKQVIVGAILGSIVAIVWLIFWLGLNELGVIMRLREGYWEPYIDSIGGRHWLPFWIIEGVKERAVIWELAAQDVVFILIEAWKEGNWKGLKALSSFPLLEIVGRDEL